MPSENPAKSSVGGHLFEPLSQDAIRDKDLFHLEDARENQRNPITFWAASAEGTCDNGSDWLRIDAEKVVDQIIFRICKIGSSTVITPKGICISPIAAPR